MESETGILVAAFKYVTRADEHICRLCFTSTEKHENFIQDSVNLKRPYYQNSVTYEDMFAELGASIIYLITVSSMFFS